jgi:hypothetical protein
LGITLTDRRVVVESKWRGSHDLVRLIGKDKTWVSGMLRILTLPPRLQKSVGGVELFPKVVDSRAKLSG